MKTVTSTENITIKVQRDSLLEGKFLPFTTLSNKLHAIETEKNLGYKQLRNRLYNSKNCNKYNMQEIAGIPCIDVKNPMKSVASLSLSFEVEE